MRGTWVFVVAVGRMVLNVWGRGADGRMVLGMFWKSVTVGGRDNIKLRFKCAIKLLFNHQKQENTYQ